MSILIEISENLQKGKAKIVKVLVQKAVDEGIAAEVILNEGLLSGMNIVGEKFKNNEVYVPEVLVAARAMNMGTQILKPLLAAEGVKATGKVVEHGKGKKVIVFKYKPKKNIRKKNGHRQPFTKVEITAIA